MSDLARDDETTRALAMPEAEIRAGIRAGDPLALRALRAQVDDFVDNDPLLQDLTRQLKRGDGPGCLVLHGSASWAPVRDPGADWSEWGDWEAWEECQIGPMKVNGADAIGPIPTGAWLAWHAPSGQILGTPPGPTSRAKAEMMALIQNAGRPTRVVPSMGEAQPSALKFGEVMAKVGPEMERLQKMGDARVAPNAAVGPGEKAVD